MTGASSLRARLGGWLHRLGDGVAGLPADLPPRAGERALMRDLAGAAARGELSLVYQPKLSARSDRIEGVEGLLRWTHPRLGPVSPAEFVPLAEQDGIIAALTRWTIARALDDRVRMTARGYAPVVSVNLSGRLVTDRALAAWTVDAAGAAPGGLGLEITETAVIDAPDTALEILHGYADAGIRIAIDDYGAGLSSLAYLKQLPASELKIDRLFISGLGSSHRDPLIVRSTIDLAHAMEMEVVAEGVESAMVLSLLRVMGCDIMQGFHIARPMPVDALCDWLDRRADAAASATAQPVAFPWTPRA